MHLRDYLRIVRERIGLVLAIMVVVGIADMALTLTQKPSYQASTRLRLLPVNVTTVSPSVAQAYVGDIATESQLVTSMPVAEQAAKDLDSSIPPQDLAGLITTNLVSTQVLEIQAQTTTAEGALKVANAFANAYESVRSAQLVSEVDHATTNVQTEVQSVEATLQQEDAELIKTPPTSPNYVTVTAERDSTNAQLVGLIGQLQDLSNQRREAQNFAQIIQPAQQATAVHTRKLSRILLFGFLIGLPLGISVVLLMDSFRDVVRGRGDLEDDAGVEVLGVVPVDPTIEDPHDVRLVTEENPLSAAAEAYRTLGLTVRRIASALHASTLVVASAGAREGRTSAITNLALAMAESGTPVVLLEADIRRPRAYELLGGDYVPGLAELLRGEVDLSETLQQLRPNLRYMGPGVVTARAEILLAGTELDSILHEITDIATAERGAFRGFSGFAGRRRSSDDEANLGPVGPQPLVLIDAGSVLEAPEASLLAGIADGVIVVARPAVTTKQGIARAADQLRRSEAKIMGAVLIGSHSPDDLGIVPRAQRGRIISLFRSKVAS